MLSDRPRLRRLIKWSLIGALGLIALKVTLIVVATVIVARADSDYCSDVEDTLEAVTRPGYASGDMYWEWWPPGRRCPYEWDGGGTTVNIGP